jgi:pimeloyl-ACP methyl ester carboxylesterase
VAAIRSSAVVVDGLRSPVIEAGDPRGREAVVFVHGSPGACGEFATLVAETGDFTRAIAPDMPGFGGADKPRPRDFIYDVPNIGVHLSKQLDALGVERAHFVGHDFGGAWATFAALYDPSRVASLSLINSGIMRGMRWHAVARLYRTPIAGEAFMMIANKWGFARSLRALPTAELDVMWRNFDRRTRSAVLALYRATEMETQSWQLPQMRLVAAEWPSIVIFGADDQFLPVKFAGRNRESIPNATVHLIDDAGHWPHLEAPERVSALLIPFLRNQIIVAPSPT